MSNKSEDESVVCGCFVVCVGIAIVIAAMMHGCAAIISACR